MGRSQYAARIERERVLQHHLDLRTFVEKDVAPRADIYIDCRYPGRNLWQRRVISRHHLALGVASDQWNARQ